MKADTTPGVWSGIRVTYTAREVQSGVRIERDPALALSSSILMYVYRSSRLEQDLSRLDIVLTLSTSINVS